MGNSTKPSNTVLQHEWLLDHREPTQPAVAVIELVLSTAVGTVLDVGCHKSHRSLHSTRKPQRQPAIIVGRRLAKVQRTSVPAASESTTAALHARRRIGRRGISNGKSSKQQFCSHISSSSSKRCLLV